MSMSINKSLNLLNGMHNENINKIFTRSIQPIIKRSGSLCKFQMKDVDLLQNPLGIIQSLPATLSKSPQPVPLIADALATCVYTYTIVIF